MNLFIPPQELIQVLEVESRHNSITSIAILDEPDIACFGETPAAQILLATILSFDDHRFFSEKGTHSVSSGVILICGPRLFTLMKSRVDTFSVMEMEVAVSPSATL